MEVTELLLGLHEIKLVKKEPYPMPGTPLFPERGSLVNSNAQW